MRQTDVEDPWGDFADADAQVQAPPRLRPVVMAAWDTAHGLGVRTPPRRRGPVAVAALAAAVVLAVAAVVSRDRPQPPVGAPDATAGAATAPAPIVRLVADARLENEPLQIVRVRIPRASLEALGITLVDSEASSLVDVDVLVGSDGLPRAIQHIGPALDDRQ
jgi:hypothetical protein